MIYNFPILHHILGPIRLHLVLVWLIITLVPQEHLANNPDSLITLDSYQNTIYQFETGIQELKLDIRFDRAASDTILFRNFSLHLTDPSQNGIPFRVIEDLKTTSLPKDASVLKLNIRDELLHPGAFNGMLRFESEYNQAYDLPLSISVKQKSFWPYMSLVFGLLVGLLIKIASKEEQWMLLKLKLKDLSLKINEIKDENIRQKFLAQSDSILVHIVTRNFSYDAVNTMYNELVKEVEERLKMNITSEDDYYIQRYRRLLIYAAHLVITGILALYAFHQFYCKNNSFGADGYMDYLNILAAAIAISYTADRLLSDRINDVINPVKKSK